MSDQYQWWRLALAGKNPPISADHPQSGYYKTRLAKAGPYQPVAIWLNDAGEMVCRVGSETRKPLDVWTFCASNPVAKMDAKHAFEKGYFPGEVPPSIGDNSGDLSLVDEINDVIVSATMWFRKTGITDQATKDMASNYRDKILKLRKRVDETSKAEKAPHEEKIDAIDAIYKPILANSKTTADALRDGMTKYMVEEEAKAKAKAAEAARIENERRAAEWKRQQEEAARAAAEAKANEPPPPPVEAPVFVAPEPVKIQAGGQSGKKSSLRTLTKYRVFDYPLALEHAKNHPDVMAAVEKVCIAQARAGATVPGTESYQEKMAV